jgi:ferric-dicitrate binding protein FerR (iron transport regulator)
MPHTKTKQEFLELVKKYTEGKATAEEIRFLNLYYENFENQPEYLATKSEEERKAIGEDIRAKIVGATFFNSKESEKNSFVYKHWFKIAAAASVILLVVIGIILTNKNYSKENTQEIVQKVQSNDILPGGNKAKLILADGTAIILDSASNGNLVSQGNMKVIKLNGQLSYCQITNGGRGQVLYNTISTPRGGQYQLILSDGSKVWLNAASSLRFPVNFTGKERKVFITGEGYFEVSENKTKPFKVEVAGTSEIEVLGTHFNVMSYSNEEFVSATLLKGSIRMRSKKTNTSMKIIPGQQAQLDDKGTLLLNQTPDIDAIMAWKNEKFVFQNMELKAVMRQLERWYDIEVTYNNDVHNNTYTGIISRKENISKILRFLESAGSDKFRIEGQKVIVN